MRKPDERRKGHPKNELPPRRKHIKRHPVNEIQIKTEKQNGMPKTVQVLIM